eukprot:g4504.t1
MTNQAQLEISVGEDLRKLLVDLNRNASKDVTIPSPTADSLSVGDLKKILIHCNKLRSKEKNIPPLHEAMRSSTILLPKSFRDVPEETEAQLKRRQYLEARQKEREYVYMTKNVEGSRFARCGQEDFNGEGTRRERHILREMESETGVVMNMIFSLLSSFVVGYVAGLHLFAHNRIRAAYLGMIAMFSLLAVEVILYATRTRKVRNTSLKQEKAAKKRLIDEQREFAEIKKSSIQLNDCRSTKTNKKKLLDDVTQEPKKTR